VIPPKGRRSAIRAAGQDVADQLAILAAGDPMGIDIAGITPLGMIELTRRRVGLSLAEYLGGERRAAAQAYEALRRAVRLAHIAKTARVVIAAGADVLALLQGRLGAARTEAAECARAEIVLRPRAEGIDVAAG